MGRKKKQLIDQMNPEQVEIDIEDLYQQLQKDHNKEDFVKKFAERLEMIRHPV